MKLRATYTFTFTQRMPEQLEGFEFRLQDALVNFVQVQPDESTATVQIEVPVDVARLHVAEPVETLDAEDYEPGIVVRERWWAADAARSTERILSFALDQRVNKHSRLGTDQLFPEDAEDIATLERLGNRPVDVRISSRVTANAIYFDALGDEQIERLAQREVGIALYLDAHAARSPTSRFRDLWRVLESAFAAKDSRLITALCEYPPAVGIGVTRDELEEFHVWRGRASHAESRAGLDEYHLVSRETEEKTFRLNSIAEVVLTTKAEWGSKSPETVALGTLRSFHQRSGELAILMTPRSLA